MRLSRSRTIQCRPADTSDLNHSRLGNAHCAAHTTSVNARCGCPDAVPLDLKRRQTGMQSHRVTRTQQAVQRNLLQEPGYNELSNKREPTSSNLTCRFQNYSIITNHVPNLSNIPFSYLSFEYPAERSSPVGSLVHVLDVNRASAVKLTSDACTNEPSGEDLCIRYMVESEIKVRIDLKSWSVNVG